MIKINRPGVKINLVEKLWIAYKRITRNRMKSGKSRCSCFMFMAEDPKCRALRPMT